MAFLNRFLQCKTSLTEPHNLQQLMTDDVCVFFGVCKLLSPDIAAEEHMFTYRRNVKLGLFWWQHIPHSRSLSIDKILTKPPLPSLDKLSSPRFWETRDQTYQGLSSLAPGVKMRDPGNEVDPVLVYAFAPWASIIVPLTWWQRYAPNTKCCTGASFLFQAKVYAEMCHTCVWG